MKCLKDQCRSPVACGGFGYCRERNLLRNAELEDAIEIIRIGAGKQGYRNYPGSGGIWAGRNENFADATFVDWGLARATATILNAVLDGTLSSLSSQNRGAT